MNRLKFLQTLIQLMGGFLRLLGRSLESLRFLAGSLESLESLGFLGFLGFLASLASRVALASLVALAASLVALAASLESLMESLVESLLASLVAQKKTGPRLILPPGARLRNMLHVIYPPKIAERVFDQIIADMRLEWEEAMAHNQKWLARWIQVRGVLNGRPHGGRPCCCHPPAHLSTGEVRAI